ncbi:MAG: tetratricopeptide repeat protein [Rhodospirillaceae bacterium]|nr:tetratricopeptide repeat protein [Rhodospirillaceae bacterium]
MSIGGAGSAGKPNGSASPSRLEGHLAKGIAAHRAGRHAEADRHYRRLLKGAPDHDQAIHLRADLAAQTERWSEATQLYRRLTGLRPERADHWLALGAAAIRAGAGDRAVAACRAATAGAPAEPGAWNNLGIALHQNGASAEALTAYDRALALDPGFAEAHANRGIALKAAGAFEDALAAFDQAIALRSDHASARQSRALTALSLGRFDQAWADYRWRPGANRQGNPRPDTPLPARLDGRRVLVLRDQGLGDELFFLRFANALTIRGAEVVYEAHPKIASILDRALSIATVVSADHAPDGADHVVSVGDLPFLLGPDPGLPPPLRLAPLKSKIARAEQALAAFGPPPWIGVTWRAGSKGPEKLGKMAPPGTLGRALRGRPGTIVAVQRNPRAGDLAALENALGRSVADLAAWNEDLEAMLGLMDRLDDYVCVSNTNLHLRAGCGKTCRVLVPHPPEFRWLSQGSETPWFPGFSVYRQSVDGDWRTAFESLAAALHS